MPSRKPKKFCRLTKFLEVTDKDLHQTFDDLCLFSLFRSRGGRGITFLYPTDKSYRKKIIDLAYSNTPEKAIDMIKALVLMDYLPSPTDFKNKKDDIPNSLKKKLEVEDADSKSVKLKGGLKLELNSSFIPLRSDDHVAVYKLSGKGELSLSGSPSTMKYTQGKTGGSYYGGDIANYKAKLTKFVEHVYTTDRLFGKNVYKFVLALIYQYAIKNTDINYKKKIYSYITASSRATYYLLVNPHSNIEILSTNLYSILAKLDDKTWEAEKNDLNLFNKSRDALLQEVGVITNVSRDSDYVVQKNILDTSRNSMEYVQKISEEYTDKQKLAQDLLSVYCYLSAIKEAENPNDNSYYKDCFLYVMKKLFNDPSYILRGTRDLAYNLTLYGNLLKSDAFLYKPKLSSQPRDSRYPVVDELPKPTDSKTLFTIEHSREMAKYGGGDGIPSEIRALMGGVHIKTELS